MVVGKHNAIPFTHFCLRGDMFVYQGLNAELLWLHCNDLPADDPEGAQALHYLFFIRRALEQCTSIAGVEQFLAQQPRSHGMALTAMDGKTGEATILECRRTTHRRLGKEAHGVLLATNHYGEGKSAVEEEGPFQRSSRRLARLQELTSRKPPQSLEDFIGLLADPQVEGRGKWSGTIQAIIAFPGQKSIWWSQGNFPAASRGTFELARWPWEERDERAQPVRATDPGQPDR